MSRRATAVTILIIWLSVIGWFVQRHYLQPRSDLLSDAALRVPPGATYFRVDVGGQQVGFASSSVDTLPDAIRVNDVLLLEIPALGTRQRVETRTEAVLSRQLALHHFQSVRRGDGARLATRGTLTSDTTLVIELETDDASDIIEVKLPGPPELPSLVPLRVAFGGERRVGQSLAFNVFEPLELRSYTVEVTILAESTLVIPDSAALDSATGLWVPARWDTLRAWRVAQQTGPIEFRGWIDELGQLIEATSPAGYTVRREPFEIAFENYQKRKAAPERVEAALGSGIVRQTAIAAGASLQPTPIEELRVRLTDIDLGAFDLSGGRQSVRGDTLLVIREPPEQLRRDPDRFAPDRSRELAPFVQPEPLIQSRDPRIEALARQIRGRDRNPVRIARDLHDWVHGHLDKDAQSVGMSALDVLALDRGDCNEHTLLYVALARAAGIPARPTTGLLWVDGHFYYHSWPEVYLNGWVAVDPTLGQFPADAAHLRFAIGRLAKHSALTQILGQVKLEVLMTRGT